MLHVSLRVLLVALGITLGGAFSSFSSAQDAASAPAAAPAEAAAPAAAAPPAAAEPLSVEQRIAVLEAYISNGDAGAGLSEAQKPTLPIQLPWPQRVDHGLCGAGSVHDAAGTCAVLWRSGP